MKPAPRLLCFALAVVAGAFDGAPALSLPIRLETVAGFRRHRFELSERLLSRGQTYGGNVDADAAIEDQARRFCARHRCDGDAYHMQQLVQRATLGERRWHTFHVREERKLRIMRYRKEHAGQYPPLGCCWSTLMSMGFRNPQAKLIGDDSDILPKHTEDRKAKSQDEIFAKIIENLDSTQEEAKQREEEEHQARVFGNRIR